MVSGSFYACLTARDRENDNKNTVPNGKNCEVIIAFSMRLW